MTKPVDLARIERIIDDVLSQEAMELVDLRYLQAGGRWVLRVFIDKHGGITLGDCERLSDRIGSVLDAVDEIPHSYSLEVSSPGLDRVLKKKTDFERFSGHRVKIRLKSPMEGRRRFNGYLRGLDEGKVVLESSPANVHLDLDAIEEARLDPEVSP
ncbi:MAG: ribosome maturation factor RimP [Elusimicrobiota bacterium]